MILGVLGAVLGYSIAGALAEFTGGKISTEYGFGLSLLLSIVYLVVGSVLARKFWKWKAKKLRKNKKWAHFLLKLN